MTEPVRETKAAAVITREGKGEIMENLVSVDIETTSDDLQGSIISIGMVNYATGEEFYEQVNFRKGVFIKPSAMLVNRISFHQMEDFSLPDLEMLDYRAYLWLKQGSTAMGRGISYFDMGFIRKDLQSTYDRFSRRLFDLTGFMMGLAISRSVRYEEIKTAALEYAERKLVDKFTDGHIGAHHALYDAWENCFVFDYLKTL